MASTEIGISRELIAGLVRLLWGPDVRHEIFQRWNQGFTFAGDEEPTALLQYDGGPCAVIVPVQAFLLKNLLFSGQSVPENWRCTNGEARDQLLVRALADILFQAGDSHVVVCDIVHDAVTSSSADDADIASTSSEISDEPAVSSELDTSHHNELSSLSNTKAASSQTAVKRRRLGHEQFHNSLRQQVCAKHEDLVQLLERKYDTLYGEYGVIVFLYSLLLTKGLQRIKDEIADVEEPLIDPVHGHGSQSLINLLLTGKAVSHVWDNEKSISGLKLQGISAKSAIGYLTLLEHLRYCEVGWYLKNPVYPIWLLGSETHLTVLFSLDRTLVDDEAQEAVVRRSFSQIDEEGRGFINVESLAELMKLLDLVSVPEYVKLMAEKLDPEQLGIITFETFVDEFYPGLFSASAEDAVRPFTVYHYNGLNRSTLAKVMYAEGTCKVPELPELQMISDFSPIKTCLMTKWPTIELSWFNNVIPSLN